MQAKRYDTMQEQTIGAGNAASINITNSANRRANYHGIRAIGRIRADNVSADNEAHGLVMLLCINDNFPILEPDVDSNTGLQELSEQIIAIEPWSVFGGSTSLVGGNTFYDFNFNIKTSRTCSRGQELRLLIVSMAESAKSVVVQHALLSCFETTI